MADWSMFFKNGFAILQGPPSCDDICNTIFAANIDDVSSAHGVRCSGCGTVSPTIGAEPK